MNVYFVLKGSITFLLTFAASWFFVYVCVSFTFLCFFSLPYYVFLNLWQFDMKNWQKMNACKMWELSLTRYWFYLFTFFLLHSFYLYVEEFHFIIFPLLIAVLNTIFKYLRDKHFFLVLFSFFLHKITIPLNKCYHVFAEFTSPLV